MKKLISFIIIFNLCKLSALFDISKDIEGEKCSVTEPLTGYKFDFSEIVSDLGYHINGNSENLGQYSFNLCKSLSGKCKNQTVSGCLKMHNSAEQVIIGYQNKLYWNNGQIRFSSIGEKCNEKTNYTLNIMLHCDYRDTKNDFLGVFHEKCEINIVLRTPKACLPVPDNIKKAKLFVTTSTNKTLNLNPLRSSNHQSSHENWIIGFPILYGHEMFCEAGTSVCFINSTETDLKKKYKNMGMMTSDMKIDENNFPVMLLTSNEPCNTSKKYSSKIVFKCNDLLEESQPKFINQSNCINYFEWETKHACVDEKPCQISGPNGDLYDFSSLAGLQYRISHPNRTNEVIHFSLCSPAKECSHSTWGSCIIKTNENGNLQTTNAGHFSEKLQINKKNVFLRYESGAICNEKGDKFSTKIEFLLADNVEDEGSVLIEDNCEIVLHYKTVLVNENGKDCIVKDRNDVEIDLRRLINYNSNYEAEIGTNESDVHYYINICRPLNSKYSLNCHGNSAACRTIIKDNKHEEELSLGHFEYSMSTEPGKKPETTNVIMKYFHGSKCPSDNDEHISSEILFYCDESAGLGNPIIKSSEHCLYNFDFPTNILCSDQHLQLSDDTMCNLINDKINKSISLKSHSIFTASDNVKVDICDNTSKIFTLNYKNSMVVVEFSQNDKDIEVQLKCGLNNNTKVDSNSNEIRIMDESTFICSFMNIEPKMEFVNIPNSNDTDDQVSKQDALNKKDSNDNSSSSSGFSLGYLFLIGVLVVAFGAFYIVLRDPERREIILNIVKFKSRRNNIRYMRVNANEESALLMGNNDHLVIPSDSDDENILL